MLFPFSGILHYSPTKLIVEVDEELSNFYRALLPKHFNANRQRYPAHISVVRNEKPSNMRCWNKYQGEKINFIYENVIHNDSVYFWLNVFCARLEEVRLELGLPVSSEFTRPPGGFMKCFHMTVGNCKKPQRNKGE